VILAAASGASGAASGARPGSIFDPANALGWAVPSLVIVPLAAFLLALSSVRTRRSASATAMLGSVTTLLLTILVAFGLAKRSTAYTADFKWFSMPIAFNGPTNFQTFTMDLVFRVDHLTVVALLVLEVIFIVAIGWHLLMGRTEPGAARFYAVLTLLLFACAGILVSTDLAELFAFWAMAGAITYLLLTHRWGVDEPALRARVALALPFLTDLCLLCGVGWFYARYGVNNLATLVPILHTNPGWTVRSIVVGSALLFVGVAGRLALWPFTTWITRTGVTAPAAAWAVAQAAWSIVAVVVLYRLTPFFVASNAQTMQVMLVVCAASAMITALLSLVGNEPKRVIALAASSATAVGAAIVINSAYHSPAAYGVAGVAAVLAIAPARVAALLAVSAIAGAMRTDDMVEMGEAWKRMPASAAAVLAGALVIGLAATGGLAYGVSTRSRLGLVLGEAVLLLSAGALRVFFAASFGQLRRRRGFDPERMREPQGAQGFPYWLLVAAVALLGASLITPYLDFLDGQKHPVAPLAAIGIWAAAAAVGFAACSFAFWRGKDSVLSVSGRIGRSLARLGNGASVLIERFLVLPSTDIARRFGGWVPGSEGALGRIASATGQLALASSRAPTLPIVLAVAVVLALVFALAAPGIVR
jgi:NADH:ubiquinone oxidoreductase subunit 5 (subunit L)/multisubunit Na+/H+ antiporter MnhA subunit